MTENNDIRILRGCKPLMAEIEYLNDKIKKERELLTGRGVPLSDMPKGSGEARDTYDELTAIEQLFACRREKIIAYSEQVRTAEKILAGVPDTNLRMMYRFLYVEHMPVWKVAHRVHMSESSIEKKKAKAEGENTLWGCEKTG